MGVLLRQGTCDAFSRPTRRSQTPIAASSMQALEERMDFITDPEEMSPSERLSELAAILAAGYMRLRKRPELAAPVDSPDSRLDSPGEQRPPLDPGLPPGDPSSQEVIG